ncbi:helix-turn-helix transcriptional regulator [Streptomyces sp. NPDC045251]|uniref:helix-turn-helix domain-containing protein n=1 Tax=unclassified Streptomyces TaxID=2593676 RepID=UPI0033DE76CD
MLDQPAFGRRLRQLRQQQNKTQSDLTGPGMSATYLSRLESGARRPTDRAVAYLAERLGVPVDTFSEQADDNVADVIVDMEVLSPGDLTRERNQRLHDALASADEIDPMTRWHGLAQLARNHQALGEFTEESLVLQDLVALSDELGRPVLQVSTRVRLARSLRGLGAMKEAREAAEQALRIGKDLRACANDVLRGKLVLASAEAELGELGRAAELSAEACAMLQDKNGSLRAEAYWTASSVAARQGNHSHAFDLLLKALDAVDSRDNLQLWIRLRIIAVVRSIEAGRHSEAQSFLDSVEPVLHLVGSPRQAEEVLYLRAKLAFHQGDLETATTLSSLIENDGELLSHRDRLRFKAMKDLLALRSGDKRALPRLKELAAEAQAESSLDLAAEIWRSIAEAAFAAD